MLQEQATQTQVQAREEPDKIFWYDKLLVRKGLIAYLPLIFAIILMFCGASWQLFWLHTDAARYECYALTYWLGGGAARLLPGVQCAFLPSSTFTQPPLHALPVEYPPLTLVIFSLGLFAPLAYYQVLFAVWMALVAAFIYWLLLRYGPRGSWLAYVLYMMIGAYATAEGRFDLVPAALTLLCVIAADRKRWTYAYLALAFAFLLKIYPILLLPPLFIAEQRDAGRFYTPPQHLTHVSFPRELWNTLRGIRQWRWKNMLIFCGVSLGITAAFALVDFQGAVLSQFSYFINRPVQVESLDSSLLFLATRFGFPAHTVYTYGSVNVISALGGPIALVFEALFVLGYCYTILLQWRGRLTMLQAFIAILLVFIATGKVFSPQYLMWVIPLLAYSGAYDLFWILAWGLISLLTTVIYPYFYTLTTDALKAPYIPGFIEFVAARNVLLLALTLAYLFGWFRGRRGRLTERDDPPG
jgi:hypothetical protein